MKVKGTNVRRRSMKPLRPSEFIRGLRNILKGNINLPKVLESNETLRLLLKRRSVRKFKDREIPDTVMTAILEAARLAPSTVNLQTWSFGVFDKQSWKGKFDKQLPFGGSRAVVICADMHRIHAVTDVLPHKPLVEYTLSVMNASIAAYAMNIAAEACGVSSVMLSETGRSGFYDSEYLREKLALPDGVFPIMTIIFGYAKREPPGMPPKLPVKQITFSDTYKEPDPDVMKDWLEQMMAGYRAVKVTQSFRGQIRHYLSKLEEAERGLHKMIFYRDEEPVDKNSI